MSESNSNDRSHGVNLKASARFWEPRRIWYNAVLLLIVLVWVVWTWPHFRPAMNWVAFGKMSVLAALANLCYCGGYVAEGFIQPLLPQAFWGRARWTVWIAGTLLAILLSNYWIADEIYPDVQQNAANVVIGADETGNASIASNMNFPAPLAVISFLGASLGLIFALAAALIFWFARKRRYARYALMTIVLGGISYFSLLFAFSALSRSVALQRGQEKYFCEIDCHLAYSIVDVTSKSDAQGSDYQVTLRTRFDQRSISRHRPQDAPLAPSLRNVRLIDSTGHEYTAVTISGMSLTTPLTPAESYATQLQFRVPKNASGLRLLVNTVPAWPDRLLIGDENSLGHKKTYFALCPF